VSQSLQRLGFNVTTIKDAGFEQLRVHCWRSAGRRRMPTWRWYFYAGHGIEVAGENWLLPVDGRLKTDADVNSEAMNYARHALRSPTPRRSALSSSTPAQQCCSRTSPRAVRRGRWTAALRRWILPRMSCCLCGA